MEAIRNDDFYTYFEKRKQALLDLVERATGKPISGRFDDFQNESSYVDEAEVNEIE